MLELRWVSKPNEDVLELQFQDGLQVVVIDLAIKHSLVGHEYPTLFLKTQIGLNLSGTWIDDLHTGWKALGIENDWDRKWFDDYVLIVGLLEFLPEGNSFWACEVEGEFVCVSLILVGLPVDAGQLLVPSTFISLRPFWSLL